MRERSEKSARTLKETDRASERERTTKTPGTTGNASTLALVSLLCFTSTKVRALLVLKSVLSQQEGVSVSVEPHTSKT